MTRRDRLTIVLSGPLRPNLAAEVLAIAPDAEVKIAETLDALHEAVEDADIIATMELTPKTMRRAKQLKWVQSWAAGPNRMLFAEMRESDVVLTCCKGNGAIPLAEHAMMLILMLDRDALRALSAQRERRWERYYHGELNGRTCGIIGAGNSGQDLALKAKAFHMRVIGLRRQDLQSPNFDEMFSRSRLHEFLAESDFVVVTAPLTEETRGMFGEREFRAMRPSAFYVCFSRGAVADEAALTRALEEGWIAGAGLDAHTVEPLPAESPLWRMPNVIVTAHQGALSEGTRQRGYEMFLENLRRFREGRPLLNLVDKHSGY